VACDKRDRFVDSIRTVHRPGCRVAPNDAERSLLHVPRDSEMDLLESESALFFLPSGGYSVHVYPTD